MAGLFQPWYIPDVGYSLSNAEMVLLLLVWEQPGITGYGIRSRADERGMRAWAGVGSSSIYNGLRRVEERGLVTGTVDTAKEDRGPRGRALRLTPRGRAALEAAVRDGLATTREHDPRFNLALSGLEMLHAADAQDCLAARSSFLASEAARLQRRRERDAVDRAPLSVHLLFDRVIHAIRAEQAWVDLARRTIEIGGPS